MYLHLGQNVIVTKESIIGIFDLDNSSWSHITRNYLNNAEKNGTLINVSDDIPKSFILCAKDMISNNKTTTADVTVYLSQLSSQTLLRRAETTQYISV
jgi:hypothetical protein